MIRILNKRMFWMLGLCVMLWCSCSDDKAPDYLIPEDTMVSLLIDVHLVDAYFYEMYEPTYLEEYMTDSMAVAYSAIFEKYGVTADLPRQGWPALYPAGCWCHCPEGNQGQRSLRQ